VPEASATRAAIGLEAEFSVLVDGEPVKPEELFGRPTAFIRQPLMHRTGRSYHLPTGGAVYFDTGVIEVATPMIEIAPGCAAQAGRSLWESIRFIREELDAWEAREGRVIQLVGFSSHYNVSFEAPPDELANGRTVGALAVLLTHLVPAPVMLLAANKRSTGIGVRPRGNRIEITADFTPDPALMVAAATVIVALVRDVMRWPSYDIRELDARGIPAFRDFAPIPHSSRKGWVARYSCFPDNPFVVDVDDARWRTRGGETLSLREIAGRTIRHFSRAIRAIADPLTLRLIGAVMRGRVPSLLELDDRPDSYMNVGHACRWDDLFPERLLPRSRYERVLMQAVAGTPLRMESAWYTPTGMRGWTHVIFRRDADGTRHTLSLDELLRHLPGWGPGARSGRRPTRRRRGPAR
jgi:hypothetical protein